MVSFCTKKNIYKTNTSTCGILVSGQLWKLNSKTLINKANLWQANDSHIWKFPTQRDDRNYFMIERSEKSGNDTKKVILEALHDDKVVYVILEPLHDDKVKEQKLSSTESKAPPTPHQLWRKGKGENEGFITLINAASNKILTAKSDNSLHYLHVKHKNETCQHIIFDQLGENVRQHPSLKNTIEIHVPIHDEESLIIHMNTSKDMPSFEFVE
jgi:hypothetical protein